MKMKIKLLHKCYMLKSIILDLGLYISQNTITEVWFTVTVL